MAARALPAPGWSARLAALDPGGRTAAPADTPVETGEPDLSNPSEVLLHELRQQVLARTHGSPEGGGRRSDSECDLHPMPDSCMRRRRDWNARCVGWPNRCAS